MKIKKDTNTQSTTDHRDSESQASIEAKKNVAKRLLENRGEKNEEKAVLLLEECVACNDTDAMVMLAECCALGRGTSQNMKRAEELLSESAMKGNNGAQRLMTVIGKWKGEKNINLSGLKYLN